MYGNVAEWCHDPYGDYKPAQGGRAAEDAGDTSPLDTTSRALRSAGFYTATMNLRSAYRHSGPPGDRNHNNGFRLARTFK
jgi:formylglycine-generating enzyme required for sulfatase activity